MRPPTGNIITQAQHGLSKAVDYSHYRNTNDDKVYAPEDGVVDSYRQRGVGRLNAGNCLRVNGAHGLHQFAHLSRSFVVPGQRVTKGQAIAVMGDTGYAFGKHLHYWVKTPGGYKYPPTLYSEAFGGPTHPYKNLVGKIVELNPKNGSWRMYRRNSDTVATTVKGRGNRYWVRDVSQKPNRVVVNSAQGGGLVDLPLADASGKEYKGEWRIV